MTCDTGFRLAVTTCLLAVVLDAFDGLLPGADMADMLVGRGSDLDGDISLGCCCDILLEVPACSCMLATAFAGQDSDAATHERSPSAVKYLYSDSSQSNKDCDGYLPKSPSICTLLIDALRHHEPAY